LIEAKNKHNEWENNANKWGTIWAYCYIIKKIHNSTTERHSAKK